MIYPSTLIKATLIKRYKRFLADVILEDGTATTVYCANTGAMTHCGSAGDTIWLIKNDNPKRKYSLSWELTQNSAQQFICINTARANPLFEDAFLAGTISELSPYDTITKEVPYGEENSRIDFLLTAENQPKCYLEVKSCTLLRDDCGYFPDTTTLRGQKHLRELTAIVKQGHKAMLCFVVLHQGINKVRIASDIDKKYGDLFRQAITAGVEVIAYQAKLSLEEIIVTKPLKVEID